ncbi:MAG: hypothetical protein ICV69_06525 [Thermoleophilaceae bacterium]|nr:hypothetical protein [Thermoleophilaceae bacterium]
MRILDERVERYLQDLRPERSEVTVEMEAVAARDSVPIVHWETGRMLATLCRALDPAVLEVGTAIGYSTLHMAEALDRGRVVTLERDQDRAEQARGYFEWAGVADRVDNLLMDREVALPEDAETTWSRDSLATARRVNADLLRSERWLGCVLPVGDGVGLAARR